MKKIVALQGVGNAGKSTAIGVVRDLLLDAGWKVVKYFRGTETTKDFVVLLTRNRVNVGICTFGDNVEQLEPYLPKFCEEKCKLIICAMRTRGSTVGYVDKLAKTNGFSLGRVLKNRTANKAEQANENKKVAKQIIQLIEKEISK